MRIEQLPTPCALVDLDRVERNTVAMADKARRLGVRLRPHVKTHACVEAAALQVRAHFGGLTVSTLAEARAFAEAGRRDLTWAVGFSPSSLVEALELSRRLDHLGLLLDHEAALAELEKAAAARDLSAEAWLEVDCGHHRGGVDPDRPESAALAARLASSDRVRFRGLLTHAGQSYDCRNRADLLAVAAKEREVLVDFARRLRAQGTEVPELSLGSTPTLSVAEDSSGIDEVRPGNYVFHDASQVEIGSCAIEDIAFSVLASTVGVAAARGECLVDAGALALSKDSTPSGGRGLVTDLDARPLAGWGVAALTQEHGKLSFPEGAAPGWGERVRILPAHSCLAAACFTSFHVVRGREVVDEWHPVRRH